MSKCAWSVNMWCGHYYFPAMKFTKAFFFPGCHWNPLWLLHVSAPPPSVWGCPTDWPSVGFMSGGMLGQSITFTLDFIRKAVDVLEVCLWLLSCWNTALQPSYWRQGIMLCFSMSQYMLTFMAPLISCSSPVSAAIILLTWLPPHMHDTVWTK